MCFQFVVLGKSGDAIYVTVRLHECMYVTVLWHSQSAWHRYHKVVLKGSDMLTCWHADNHFCVVPWCSAGWILVNDFVADSWVLCCSLMYEQLCKGCRKGGMVCCCLTAAISSWERNPHASAGFICWWFTPSTLALAALAYCLSIRVALVQSGM